MHQIGVGVLGPVFRTYDPDHDRLVALKAFHLDLTPEQAGTLAAALNGIAQAGLSHPSLVMPVGAGLSAGVPYLASEYVAAETLDVAIRHYAPAAVGTALTIVVQLADALDTAHLGGLSHGALHLRDIFVTPELARVTGFGVVSALERVRLRGPLRRPYTAPEQIADAEWGPAADRFALAAIAYELLTGKRAAGTGEQVTDRLAGVSGVRDPESLTRLFAGALADTPETRPGSARLFADELADAVGWTGAPAVRQALVRMDSGAGDPEHQVSDDAPVFAVAGVSVRPSAGVETTGTEGTALAMTTTNSPKRTPKPALDWTERSLDRGESDELREPEAYQPRPPGAPPAVKRATRGAVPDLDRIDAALDGTNVADGDDGGREAAAGRRTHAEPRTPQHDRDRPVPTVEGRAGDGGAPTPGDGALLDQLDPEPGARTVHAAGAAPAPDDPNDDDDDVGDLPVLQARYRPVDGRSEPASDAPEGQAAGVYKPITLSDRQDRGGTADPPEDDSDWDWGADDAPAGPEARDADADGRRVMVDFDSEDDHDRDGHDDGYDEDEIQAGVVASCWATVRRLPVVPLALVAVVITIAFFAVLGWVAGGGGGGTDEPTAAGAVMAGGLADPSDAPEPAEPAPPLPVTREFSEATVAGSRVAEAAPVEAPVETSPAPPAPPTTPTAEPAPQPEIPESAGRPAPVAATEAPVAPAPIAPAVPEPAPPSGTGRLLVRSTPPGVRVVVNGEMRGTTPLALADLSYGAYDVGLSLEGYETQERRLAISSDDAIAVISAELARVPETRTASLGVGSIFVDTRPRGAEVWLDQHLVGESPMLIQSVSAGAHEVEFRYAGYRDWVTTVEVGSSVQARVTASLDHAPR